MALSARPGPATFTLAPTLSAGGPAPASVQGRLGGGPSPSGRPRPEPVLTAAGLPGRYVALLYRQPEPYAGGLGERALDGGRAKFDLGSLGLGLPAGVRYFVSQR